jgi:hypothetical protein
MWLFGGKRNLAHTHRGHDCDDDEVNDDDNTNDDANDDDTDDDDDHDTTTTRQRVDNDIDNDDNDDDDDDDDNDNPMRAPNAWCSLWTAWAQGILKKTMMWGLALVSTKLWVHVCMTFMFHPPTMRSLRKCSHAYASQAQQETTQQT